MGGDSINRLKASEILADLQRQYSDKVFVSPIHGICCGLGYDEVPQKIAITRCLELLKRCDEVWSVEGWDESAGCSAEFNYCKTHKIPLVSCKMNLNK